MSLQRESSRLEYESEVSNSFLKTVSAYANYHGGIVHFGIDDKGSVVGITDPVKECLNIENKINDNIHPTPKFTLSIDESSNTIILEVFEGPHKPYLYKNKAYKRADSSTTETDRVEFTRLILEGSNKDFEELPAFNQNLTFQYLESSLKKTLHIDQLNMDILKTLDLYSDAEGYNRAAEILADQNQFSGLDIARFGKNINEFLSREVLEGISALEQYDQAMKLFDQYYQFEVIEGGHRKKIEIIPKEAFREALANSLVHRMWDVRRTINISMHEDRIEIASPGGLLPGISKEEYLKGQVSMLRNPILGNVFFRLKYIEKFGTGIRRILHAYEDNVVKPEFSLYENSIEVKLPIIERNSSMLSSEEQIVFHALSNRGALSRLEIQRLSDLSKDKTIRILNALTEKNIIERTGTGRGTKYRRL